MSTYLRLIIDRVVNWRERRELAAGIVEISGRPSWDWRFYEMKTEYMRHVLYMLECFP